MTTSCTRKNSLYSISFSVRHAGDEPTADELRDALKRRYAYLRNAPDHEIIEACADDSDSFDDGYDCPICGHKHEGIAGETSVVKDGIVTYRCELCKHSWNEKSSEESEKPSEEVEE